ncbi:MAG: prepilin peptidase [Phycisphaeraceae bacterium]|nr:prepilin peptidase [Phycisphaeraceae bacterium]
MNLWPYFFLAAIYGAIVGSFLNVVIYRLPEGLSLLHPPSRCPSCEHKLAVYDNVPVLGWLWLRGKCRYCKAPISAQYPLIEALTAALFAAMFWSYYLAPMWSYENRTGVHWTSLWLEWHAAGGLLTTWPALLVHAVLIASLIAATMIDFRLYIIPLQIPWMATAVALIVLPLGVWFIPVMETVCPSGDALTGFIQLFMERTCGIELAPGSPIGLAAGAVLGLLIACGLLKLGWLPRSFDEEPAPHEDGAAGDNKTPAQSQKNDKSTGASMVPASPAVHEDFLAHPHPRWEVGKELLFLLFPIVGAIIGWFIPVSDAPRPLWVAAGVVSGYLVGGGMIWATRILGTLAFGKEAMGLGDVHLLAAVGAVLGPRDAVVIFFIAPFLGLAYAAISVGVARIARGEVRVIPYGPYLAAATVVLMFFHQPILNLLPF